MDSLLKLYARIKRDWPHILASWGGVEMVMKFHYSQTADYQGLTFGLVGIVGILTGKHYWDTKSDKIKVDG
jgi:hypothetical protein